MVAAGTRRAANLPDLTAHRSSWAVGAVSSATHMRHYYSTRPACRNEDKQHVESPWNSRTHAGGPRSNWCWTSSHRSSAGTVAAVAAPLFAPRFDWPSTVTRHVRAGTASAPVKLSPAYVTNLERRMRILPRLRAGLRTSRHIGGRQYALGPLQCARRTRGRPCRCIHGGNPTNSGSSMGEWVHADVVVRRTYWFRYPKIECGQSTSALSHFNIGVRPKKGSGPKSRNGPSGASHFWVLTPFSSAAANRKSQP
jgi:hypothetical protein